MGSGSNVTVGVTERGENAFENMVAVAADSIEEHAVCLIAKRDKVRQGWRAAKPPAVSFVES